jgi:hypothetical protein
MKQGVEAPFCKTSLIDNRQPTTSSHKTRFHIKANQPKKHCDKQRTEFGDTRKEEKKYETMTVELGAMTLGRGLSPNTGP